MYDMIQCTYAMVLEVLSNYRIIIIELCNYETESVCIYACNYEYLLLWYFTTIKL